MEKTVKEIPPLDDEVTHVRCGRCGGEYRRVKFDVYGNGVHCLDWRCPVNMKLMNANDLSLEETRKQ